MAWQRPRRALGCAEYGVLRVHAGEQADPTRRSILCTDGLWQPRWLLANARGAEQA